MESSRSKRLLVILLLFQETRCYWESGHSLMLLVVKRKLAVVEAGFELVLRHSYVYFCRSKGNGYTELTRIVETVH